MEAFEARETLPLKFPEDCGAKVTLKDTFCPGANVTGVVMPEMLKPVPETDACEIVALTPPTLFTVSVCVWFWPICTFVNVKLPGVALRIAGTVGVVPVPETAMSNVVLDPLMVIESVPLLAPATVGAKTTPNVVLWFGASVIGRLSPV